MAQTKATKKFEKRHLKDILERRNGLRKVKQKQQLKAKRKAKKAEENGQAHGAADSNAQDVEKNEMAQDAFKGMTVDDFFQGGFDVPELPKPKSSKRKRQDGDEEVQSEDSLEYSPVVGDDLDDDDSEEDEVGHKQQLDALANNDPEFHKYLMDNEPELLDGKLADIGAISEDDDDEPQRKKTKRSRDDEVSEDDMKGAGKNELDMATVKRWRRALTEQHSLRAAREIVLAFRSAAHVSEDDDRDFKYSISSPEVYHELLTTALKNIPLVFEHHLPVQEGKSGKTHVLTESKKFKTLAPLLRSHMVSIIHLLESLSDAATLRLTLSSALPLLSYLLSFKKLVKDISRAAAAVWSTTSTSESTRVAAFLVLRRLVVIGDAAIRENVLKTTYQALIRGARNTTIHTMPGVNLMKNSAAELWSIAAEGEGGAGVAYTTAFTSIRQLAVHLRSSIIKPGNESYKTIYNWQYVHGLDFWSRVLSSSTITTAAVSAKSAGMQPLIYPLVQVTLGALRLIPTATYFPLRFQLIRSLLRISLATGTYIPLAPALYEVLNSAEMRKAPKASTLKPLDFSTSIRAPLSYLRTRVYQDGIGEQVVELLSEFFVLQAKSVAFPELSLATTVLLKRWLKEANNRAPTKGNRNQKLNGALALLVQKLEANARWIEERRAKVEFAPNDRKGVEAFLQDISWEKTPLGGYVVGERKRREDRAKVLEKARREEDKEKEKERKARRQAQEADEEDAEEEDNNDADDEVAEEMLAGDDQDEDDGAEDE